MTESEPLTSYRGYAGGDNWQRTQRGWLVYLFMCYKNDGMSYLSLATSESACKRIGTTV